MPEKRRCPHCNEDNYSADVTREEWKCANCGRPFKKKDKTRKHVRNLNYGD